MNLFIVVSLVVCLLSACLGVFTFFQIKKRLHFVWALFNLDIAVWSGGIFLAGISKNEFWARIDWKLSHIGVLFIPVLFYHTVCLFLDSKDRRILYLLYFQAFFFTLLLIFTNYIIFPIKYLFGSIYYFVATPGYYVMFTIWLVVVALPFFKLYSGVSRLKGLQYQQWLYLFWGSLLGFMGGPTIVAPAFGLNVYPAWHFTICIYVLIATYAIFRYRLLDIRVAMSNMAIFIAVYSLVLGIPFWIGFKLFGYGLWFLPVIFMGVLASVGPSIYIFLQRQAKDKILEEQKRYRKVLDNAAIVVNRLKTVDEIVQYVSKVFFTDVGIKNAAFYLRKGEVLFLRTTETNETMFQKEINNKQLIEYFVQKNHSVIIKEMHENGDKNKQNINGVIKESQTEVAVPLVKSDSLVGLILLGEKNNDSPYSDDDLKAFSSNSSHFALAIENVQYLDEQKKLNEEENKNRRQFQLDKLVSSMGHQIRNPLNVISGAMTGIEIVMKKYKPLIEERYYNKLEEKKNEIMVACGGISTTINTILDYGRGTIELRRIKVNDIVKEFNILTQMIIGKYMVSPNLDVEKDVPDVFGDIHTINEILSTYFDNSCQAVETNGGVKKIDFKIYKMDGEYVRFEIADNGHGIDEDTQRAIFDVSTSTKGTKGHGFGLVSVRKACSQMKGTNYDFYSAGRGFGSKFWIDVPIATN